MANIQKRTSKSGVVTWRVQIRRKGEYKPNRRPFLGYHTLNIRSIATACRG